MKPQPKKKKFFSFKKKEKKKKKRKRRKKRKREYLTKAEITIPSVVKDLLIFAPSFNLAPVAPVESALSLPAKSTKLILLTFFNFYFYFIFIVVIYFHKKEIKRKKKKEKKKRIKDTFSVESFVCSSNLFWLNIIVKTA